MFERKAQKSHIYASVHAVRAHLQCIVVSISTMLKHAANIFDLNWFKLIIYKEGL
jgi:hypothetical protein